MPLHKAAARRAPAAEAFFRHNTPRRSSRSTWLLVGSTPSVTTKRHTAGSNPSRLAQNVAAFVSAQRRPRQQQPVPAAAPGRPAAAASCRPVDRRRRGTDATPRTRRTPPAAAPAQRRRRAARAIDQLLEVAFEMRPAHLAAERRQPAVDAPAVAAHQCRRPPRPTAPPGRRRRGGRGSRRRPRASVAATHSQHRAPASFQLVSSTCLTGASRTAASASAWAGARATLIWSLRLDDRAQRQRRLEDVAGDLLQTARARRDGCPTDRRGRRPGAARRCGP